MDKHISAFVCETSLPTLMTNGKLNLPTQDNKKHSVSRPNTERQHAQRV